MDCPVLNPIVKTCLKYLFPSTCVVCRDDIPHEGGSPVCEGCLSGVSWLHRKQKGMKPLSFYYAPLDFHGPCRDLIHAYKYQGKDYLTPVLVDLWLTKWRPEKENIDCLVPVPMPFWKEIRRGYNQAALLAHELGKRTLIPVESGWLKRTPLPKPQAALSQTERAMNAMKSFTLNKKPKEMPKRVLLIDDVSTTGATLKVCARLLKKAGIEEVWGSTLAYERKKVDIL